MAGFYSIVIDNISLEDFNVIVQNILELMYKPCSACNKD